MGLIDKLRQWPRETPEPHPAAASLPPQWYGFDLPESVGQAHAPAAAPPNPGSFAGARVSTLRSRHPGPQPSTASPSGWPTQAPALPAAGTFAQSWQADAWEVTRLVPEQRYLVNTLAQRTGMARWFLATSPKVRGTYAVGGHTSVEPPTPAEDSPVARAAHELLERLAPTQEDLAQIQARLAQSYLVTGEAYLFIPPTGATRVLSTSEVVLWGDPNTPSVRLFLSPSDVREYSRLRDAPLYRLWKPDPEFWWIADSPTRSLLPVLRENVGLGMHLAAQIDSRLAGAGVWLFPQSWSQAARREAGLDPSDASDPFVEAATQAMVTPYADPSSASRLVPLMAAVPLEQGDDLDRMTKHISFATPLDDQLTTLLTQNIHRIALGHDCPPELLEGTATSSHWSAWLTRDDVISSHLVPLLSLTAQGINEAYLRPALIQKGFSAEEAASVMLWFDTEGMSLRPNRSEDAKVLYDRGEITGAVLRDALGFTSDDAAPSASLTIARREALNLVRKNPALAAAPGLAYLISAMEAIYENAPAPDPAPVTPGSPASEVVAAGGDRTGNPARSQGPVRSDPSPPSEQTPGNVAPGSQQAPTGQANPLAPPHRTPA